MSYSAANPYNEDAPHTSGDAGTEVLAVRKDTQAALAGTDGDYTPLQTNATGGLRVDGSAVTQPVSGTVTANAGTGTMAVSIATAPVLVAGSAIIGKVGIDQTTPGTTNGVQLTAGTAAIGKLTANTGVTIGAVEIAASQTLATVTTVSTVTGGGVAHDGVDSGNPIKTGGQARTTNPTAVADADRSNFITDKLGKQVVVGSIRDLKVSQVTTITSSTAETTIVTAGAASVFHDLYGLIITNTSATAVNVAIKDATAGTTRMNIAVPAGDTRGFMVNESGAHNQATAANNWTATCSASVASVIITALAVKNI